MKKNDMSMFALSSKQPANAGGNRVSAAPGASMIELSVPVAEGPVPRNVMRENAVPDTQEQLSGVALEGARATCPISSPVVEPILFEDVVNRYHDKVFRLVYRYVGDYDEACDLTQDTFVRAYGAWQEFRGESQVYTWLHRIAINLCLNHQKKTQRRRRVEAGSLDQRSGEHEGEQGSPWNGFEAADERPLPLQVLESQELRVRLQEVLCELPDNYRTVIILRDMEGLTYDEIARITESTLETIKSRLFRARNALRRLMEPYLTASNADLAPSTAPVTPTTRTRPLKAHFPKPVAATCA